MAAELLLKLIREGEQVVGTQIVISPQLVVRRSSGE
jgi:DNA-binding LacI/PurR family transcriptional regulator